MVACKKTSNPAFVKYKGLKARVEKTDIYYIMLLEVQMQEHPLTRGAERTLSRLKNLGWAEKCEPALKSVRGVGCSCSVRHQWMGGWCAGCLTSRSLRAAGDFGAQLHSALCSAVKPGLHLPVDVLHANGLSPPPHTITASSLHFTPMSPPPVHPFILFGKMSYIKM